MHRPVLLNEVVRFLNPQLGEFIIDGTVGEGGHAREILRRVGSTGKLIGIDWSQQLLERARGVLGKAPNVTLVRGNYADLPTLCGEQGWERANGLLLDLGLSSTHVAELRRGFSFRPSAGRDEPLLMTYSDERTPVREFLSTLDEKELTRIIRTYGEERYAGRIARAIAKEQRERPIETAKALVEIVVRAVPAAYRHGRIHPATRTFQALRIYANDEIGNLKRLCSHFFDILTPSARIVIISFHSLEDRVVKRAFRELGKEKALTVLTKKPVTPSKKEIRENPRSRSAKLRAARLM